jgi:hypothetical protein
MGSPVFIGFQTILVAYDASRRWLRAWSDILAGSWTQMGTVVRENTKGSAGKTWRKRAPALLRGQNEARCRKIARLVPHLDEMVDEGLIAVSDVEVIRYIRQENVRSQG